MKSYITSLFFLSITHISLGQIQLFSKADTDKSGVFLNCQKGISTPLSIGLEYHSNAKVSIQAFYGVINNDHPFYKYISCGHSLSNPGRIGYFGSNSNGYFSFSLGFYKRRQDDQFLCHSVEFSERNVYYKISKDMSDCYHSATTYLNYSNKNTLHTIKYKFSHCISSKTFFNIGYFISAGLTFVQSHNEYPAGMSSSWANNQNTFLIPHIDMGLIVKISTLQQLRNH